MTPLIIIVYHSLTSEVHEYKISCYGPDRWYPWRSTSCPTKSAFSLSNTHCKEGERESAGDCLGDFRRFSPPLLNPQVIFFIL